MSPSFIAHLSITTLVMFSVTVVQTWPVSLSGLTKSQENAIQELRERVENSLPHAYMSEDLYLLRWLTAKDFDVDAAEKLLRENLKWRAENDIDNILLEDFSQMEQEYPYQLNTIGDKMGRPILYFSFGEWDIRKLAVAGLLPKLNRYFAKMFEDADNQVRVLRSRGKNITQFNMILNMDSYNVPQHACFQCLPFYTTLTQTLEARYPGTAERVIFVNSPTVFGVVLRLIQGVLSTKSSETMKIYGSDRKLLAIQRGNAVSVMGTFPPSKPLSEIANNEDENENTLEPSKSTGNTTTLWIVEETSEEPSEVNSNELLTANNTALQRRVATLENRLDAVEALLISLSNDARFYHPTSETQYVDWNWAIKHENRGRSSSKHRVRLSDQVICVSDPAEEDASGTSCACISQSNISFRKPSIRTVPSKHVLSVQVRDEERNEPEEEKTESEFQQLKQVVSTHDTNCAILEEVDLLTAKSFSEMTEAVISGSFDVVKSVMSLFTSDQPENPADSKEDLELQKSQEKK